MIGGFAIIFSFTVGCVATYAILSPELHALRSMLHSLICEGKPVEKPLEPYESLHRTDEIEAMLERERE